MTVSSLAAPAAPTEKRWLHRYAVAVSVATFCLIIAGGLVTSTGSGYASPEPVRIGHFEGTGLYENSHRVLGRIVGTLVVGAVVLCLVVERRSWVRWLSITALAAVVAQGLLGMLTVGLKLPPLVSITHAGLAEITLALIVALAMVTSPWWAQAQPSPDAAAASKSRRRALSLVLVVYVQILLGAWYRHTSSQLALWCHILWVVAVAMHVLMMKQNRALMTLFLGQMLMGPIALMFTKGKVIKEVGQAPESLSRALPITLHVALGAALLATAVIALLRAQREMPRSCAPMGAP